MMVDSIRQVQRVAVMTRVLLVDDDLELGEMLTEYLDREGFATTAVQDGETGVRQALSGAYGILVLDVMMPGLNGIEVAAPHPCAGQPPAGADAHGQRRRRRPHRRSRTRGGRLRAETLYPA